MALSIYEGLNSEAVKHELKRAQIGGHTQLLSAHRNYFAVFDLAPDASAVVYRSRSLEVSPEDATYDIITGARFSAVQRKGLLLRRIVECPIQEITIEDRLVLSGAYGTQCVMPRITDELWRPVNY